MSTNGACAPLCLPTRRRSGSGEIAESARHFSAKFPAGINLSHGVRGVDRQLLEMARLYRFSRWKTLRHVTLPSIRPYFNSAMEIVIGGGWKLAVMGEVLTTNSGIGGAITSARLNVQPDAIIAWSFLLVVGCFLTQKLLRLICCRKGAPVC